MQVVHDRFRLIGRGRRKCIGLSWRPGRRNGCLLSEPKNEYAGSENKSRLQWPESVFVHWRCHGKGSESQWSHISTKLCRVASNWSGVLCWTLIVLCFIFFGFLFPFHNLHYIATSTQLHSLTLETFCSFQHAALSLRSLKHKLLVTLWFAG